ncbi:MAG TPA: hypothetical protein VL328_00115 [Gemmatimonadaceae bacterium]|jgi:hypothetical protein|nr:hypothetical protein [Gemmatimonadaceae bacterium]
MTDRDERTDRTPSSDEPTRHEKRTDTPPHDGIPPVNREGQKSTVSRPRGQTEEPDRTL